MPDIIFASDLTSKGENAPLCLREVDCRQHSNIIGSTGADKSNPVKNMVIQDIRAGVSCFAVTIPLRRNLF